MRSQQRVPRGIDAVVLHETSMSRSNQSRSEMAAGQSAWQEAIRPSSFKRQKARQGGGVQVLANIPGPGS
jgi:hypothetical protein